MALAYIAPGPMELLILVVLFGVPAAIVFVVVLVVAHQTKKAQAEFERRQADTENGIVEAEIIPTEISGNKNQSP